MRVPAPTIDDSEWDKHKETIRSLYVIDRCRLDELIRTMQQDHEFRAR